MTPSVPQATSDRDGAPVDLPVQAGPGSGRPRVAIAAPVRLRVAGLPEEEIRRRARTGNRGRPPGRPG
jgi:hypothetical protein